MRHNTHIFYYKNNNHHRPQTHFNPLFFIFSVNKLINVRIKIDQKREKQQQYFPITSIDLKKMTRMYAHTHTHSGIVRNLIRSRQRERLQASKLWGIICNESIYVCTVYCTQLLTVWRKAVNLSTLLKNNYQNGNHSRIEWQTTQKTTTPTIAVLLQFISENVRKKQRILRESIERAVLRRLCDRIDISKFDDLLILEAILCALTHHHSRIGRVNIGFQMMIVWTKRTEFDICGKTHYIDMAKLENK